MIIWTVAVTANLLLIAGLSYYTIRAKRWLWSEIGKVQSQQEETQPQLVAARKQIVLNAFGGACESDSIAEHSSTTRSMRICP